MNYFFSIFTIGSYLPVINRDKFQLSNVLLLITLCFVFITPSISAEESLSEPLQSIKIVDITGQAEEIESHLSQIEVGLSSNEIDDQSKLKIEEFNQDIETMQASLKNILAKRFEIFELLELSSSWNLLQGRLHSLKDQFEERSDKLSQELEIIQQNKQIWSLTRKAKEYKTAPKTVKKRVVEILKLLDKLQGELKVSRNFALDILVRISKKEDLVNLAIKQIEDAKIKQVSNILQAQDAPIWISEENDTESQSITSSFNARVDELKTGLIKFSKDHHVHLLVQMVVTLFFGWFIAYRNRLISQGEKAQEYVRDALKHPWAAALLFSLYMTPFLYDDRTLGFNFLVILTSLPLWLRVLSGMLPAAFRMPLIILISLALIEHVRFVFGGFSILSRWVLIVEFIIALIALRWFIPRYLKQLSSKFNKSFWYKILKVWLSLSIPIFGIGVIAVIFGYSELARKISFLMIWALVVGVAFIAIVRITEAILQSYIDLGHFDFLNMIRINRHPFVKLTRRILRTLGFVAWAFLLLRANQFLNPVLDVTTMILTAQLGVEPVKFSLGGILAFAFTLWFSWLLARFVNLILDNEIFSRMSTPPGVPFAITTFSRYIILVVGFLAAVSVLGFSLDKITIVLGALGVGIGFGLQNITSNFVSGIILLFERPIRVGDKIQFDDLIGKVSSIGIRASKITSFDGSDVIVPNADFISSRVINWTFSDEKRRVIVPFSASFETDPEQVLELLLKVAKNHPEIIDTPEPEALFQNFGESSLEFELRAWTESERGWVTVKSDLTLAIHKALKEAGIKIPFPQRDVNLRQIPEL